MFHSNTEGISFQDGKSENVDFSGRSTLRCNFTGSHYVSCTLNYIDTRWSFLGGVEFNNCKLVEADFEYAVLNGSTVEGGRVNATRFENCGELTGVNFSNTDMEGVRFGGNTSLKGAFYSVGTTGLSDAQKSMMVDITLKNRDGSIHPRGHDRKLTLANIQRTSFMVQGPGGFTRQTMSLLEGLDLTNANLRGMSFTRKSLAGANLTGADLTMTDLNGANLRNVNMNNVMLSANKMLIEADFTGASLANTDITGVDFTRANFSNATIENVHTDGNVFTRGGTSVVTSFQGANFTGAMIQNSRFKFSLFGGANFSGATIGYDVNNNIIPHPQDVNDAVQNAAAFLSNDFANARFNDRSQWVLWTYRGIQQIGDMVAAKKIVDIGDRNE